MKRYFLGIIAVIIAFASVAFTQIQKDSKENLATFTFRYIPTSDFSQSAVQDKTNWEAGTSGCEGGLDACTMEVQESYTHLEGTRRVLNNTGNAVNIVATGSGNHYSPDPASSTGILSATNQD